MFDDLVKHRVELEKLKNEIAYKVLKQFAQAYPTMKQYIININNKNRDLVISQIMQTLDQNMGNLSSTVLTNGIDVLKYETQFQTELLSRYKKKSVKSSAVISDQLATTLIYDNHMAGDLFKDSWLKMSTGLKSELSGKIRLAVTNGLTADQISKEMKGSMVSFSDKQLNSLTRTLIQNATNIAAEETYKSNDIEYVQYCAILDSRTTQICHDLNGKIFKVGEGPRPPQHYNCRSFTIPVDGKNGIAVDPSFSAFVDRQAEEEKKGLTSSQKDKFETTTKISLDTLIKKLR